MSSNYLKFRRITSNFVKFRRITSNFVELCQISSNNVKKSSAVYLPVSLNSLITFISSVCLSLHPSRIPFIATSAFIFFVSLFTIRRCSSSIFCGHKWGLDFANNIPRVTRTSFFGVHSRVRLLKVNTLFYGQLGCVAFSLRFWPKVE